MLYDVLHIVMQLYGKCKESRRSYIFFDFRLLGSQILMRKNISFEQKSAIRRQHSMVSANIFKQYPFFKGFSETELNKFEELASEQSFQRGFQLWKKGDESKSLCLLEEGKVVLAMECNVGGHIPPMQVTVDIISKGDVMGWSAVVEPYAYTLGARCIDDTKVIALDAVKLRKILHEDTGLGFKFMNAIAKVIATRLTHTEIILVGDRLSVLTKV